MNEEHASFWHDRLTTGPFQGTTFSGKQMQRIETRIARNLKKSKKRIPVLLGSCGMVIVLISLFVFIPRMSGNTDSGHGTITDDTTRAVLNQVAPSGDSFVVDPMYDNMDRGNHELEKQVVIDPNYYQIHPLKRGEIIYYDGASISNRLQNGELSRVVGLPGEKIKIQKGQVYVNGQKLETFYGKAHMRGIDRQTFLGIPENPDLNKESILKEVFDFSMEEVSIPKQSVFIIGDDWFRSLDSRYIGSVPVNLIKGKVAGICDSCSATKKK